VPLGVLSTAAATEWNVARGGAHRQRFVQRRQQAPVFGENPFFGLPVESGDGASGPSTHSRRTAAVASAVAAKSLEAQQAAEAQSAADKAAHLAQRARRADQRAAAAAAAAELRAQAMQRNGQIAAARLAAREAHIAHIRCHVRFWAHRLRGSADSEGLKSAAIRARAAARAAQRALDELCGKARRAAVSAPPASQVSGADAAVDDVDESYSAELPPLAQAISADEDDDVELIGRKSGQARLLGSLLAPVSPTVPEQREWCDAVLPSKDDKYTLLTIDVLTTLHRFVRGIATTTGVCRDVVLGVDRAGRHEIGDEAVGAFLGVFGQVVDQLVADVRAAAAVAGDSSTIRVVLVVDGFNQNDAKAETRRRRSVDTEKLANVVRGLLTHANHTNTHVRAKLTTSLIASCRMLGTQSPLVMLLVCALVCGARRELTQSARDDVLVVDASVKENTRGSELSVDAVVDILRALRAAYTAQPRGAAAASDVASERGGPAAVSQSRDDVSRSGSTARGRDDVLSGSTARHSALARGRSPTRSRSRSTARGERSDGAPAVSPASTGVAATADVDLVEQRGRASTDASVRLRARSAAPDSSVRTRQRSASCERGARVAESRRPVRMAASRAKATLAALADRDVDSAVDAPLEPLTAEQQASISMQALRRNCAHVGSVSRRRSCSATPRRLEPGGAGGGGGGGRQSTRTRVEFSVVIARGEGEQTCAALAARAARCERPAIVSSGDTDAIVHLSRQLLMVAKHDVALFDRLAALVSVWSGNRRASLHSALAQLRRDFPDVEPQHIYLAHVLTGCDTTRQHSARVGFPTALRRVMRAKSPARVWLSDVVGDLDALGFFKKARYASFKKSLQLHERAVAESDETIDAVARALAAGSATAGSRLRVGSCHLDAQRDAVAQIGAADRRQSARICRRSAATSCTDTLSSKPPSRTTPASGASSSNTTLQIAARVGCIPRS
jgi:hypothetical protein